MTGFGARFQTLYPTIKEICRVSGTPGVSIGVLHRNEVYTQAFGFRDVDAKLSPDENTIYYLASLSKAFTASAVAKLVEQKKIEWTTPIRDVLDRFSHNNPIIQDQSTIVDWLSHRTGLAPKNALWVSEFGHASLKRDAALPMISYLEQVFDFRSRWLYSNWGYALADAVVEKLGGESWGNVLKEHIFDPLQMNRTITDHDTPLDNVAEAYMALTDGSPYHLPRPFPEDGKVMEGAVAVQSNVRDLLTFYKALMEAAEDQTQNGRTSTEGNPLTQLPMLFQAHISLSPDISETERGYGLGWVRVQLPTTLGAIGLNPTYVGKMPVVGKGLKQGQSCIYHQGSNNTFLSSVHLLPESGSAVVVLTNSMANNDAADWLGELLLEAVLENPDPNDYLKLAKASAYESKERWVRMREEMEKSRKPDTPIKPFDAYCGSYVNVVNTYSVDVFRDQDQLKMCFQGDRRCAYSLEHHQYDTFSWLLTRDEDVHYGRFPVTQSDFYLLAFECGKKDKEIDRLIWINDPVVPSGEVFRKSAQKPSRAENEGEPVLEGPA